MKVNVEKNGTIFQLKATIRDDIMKLESTPKTKRFGVPEYLQKIFDGAYIQTYYNKGWSVSLMK